MKRIISYFQEAYGELKKVVWPKRQDVVNHTIIVMASIIVVMAILALIDFGLTKGLQLLIENWK